MISCGGGGGGLAVIRCGGGMQYRLGHRENKAYTLGLWQLLVFIAVAMNIDDFFSYQCIRFIFSIMELRNFSMTELVL